MGENAYLKRYDTLFVKGPAGDMLVDVPPQSTLEKEIFLRKLPSHFEFWFVTIVLSTNMCIHII